MSRSYASERFPEHHRSLDLGAPTAGPEFVPTLAIKRPVLLPKPARREIEGRLKKGMNHADHAGSAFINDTSYFDPESWTVTLTEAQSLSYAAKASEITPTVSDIENLTDRLVHNFGRSLADTEPRLSLVLGQVEPFGKRYRREHVIGVMAVGSDKVANAKNKHSRQRRIPQGTLRLFAERELAMDTITHSMFLDHESSFVTSEYRPHISVAMNRKGFSDKQVRTMAKVVKSALPQVITLGDPVIYVSTKGRGVFEQVHVRRHVSPPRRMKPSLRREVSFAG